MERPTKMVDLFIDIDFYGCIRPFTVERMDANIVFFSGRRLYIRSSVWCSKGIHVFNQTVFSQKVAVSMETGAIQSIPTKQPNHCITDFHRFGYRLDRNPIFCAGYAVTACENSIS